MNIELFIIAWNEEKIIGYVLDYYKDFCSKMTVFDNYSDDSTEMIAKSYGADVIKFGVPGVLDDGEYIKIKNNCWKNSAADWVIVCDCDEIVYRNNLLDLLYSDATIIKSRGFNVYSNENLKDSLFNIQTGFFDENYSKTVLFRPNKIKAIDYVYGAHVCNPKGEIKYHADHVYLLHYRAIGGVENMIQRHEKYKKRLSELNKRWNLGHHYSQPDEQKRADFEDSLKKCVTFSEAGIM